jgi:hypothetical protein
MWLNLKGYSFWLTLFIRKGHRQMLMDFAAGVVDTGNFVGNFTSITFPFIK